MPDPEPRLARGRALIPAIQKIRTRTLRRHSFFLRQPMAESGVSRRQGSRLGESLLLRALNRTLRNATRDDQADSSTTTVSVLFYERQEALKACPRSDRKRSPGE
jgi:hypothetical protein